MGKGAPRTMGFCAEDREGIEGITKHRSIKTIDVLFIGPSFCKDFLSSFNNIPIRV
jgi:hypothetical protein